MAIQINDYSVSLAIDARIVAIARFRKLRPTATARGSSQLTPPGCSPGTKRSLRWQSPSKGRAVIRTATRSWSRSKRSYDDGPADQSYDGASRGGGRRHRRDHLVPACVRTSHLHGETGLTEPAAVQATN